MSKRSLENPTFIVPRGQSIEDLSSADRQAYYRAKRFGTVVDSGSYAAQTSQTQPKRTDTAPSTPTAAEAQSGRLTADQVAAGLSKIMHIFQKFPNRSQFNTADELLTALFANQESLLTEVNPEHLARVFSQAVRLYYESDQRVHRRVEILNQMAQDPHFNFKSEN